MVAMGKSLEIIESVGRKIRKVQEEYLSQQFLERTDDYY